MIYRAVGRAKETNKECQGTEAPATNASPPLEHLVFWPREEMLWKVLEPSERGCSIVKAQSLLQNPLKPGRRRKKCPLFPPAL